MSVLAPCSVITHTSGTLTCHLDSEGPWRATALTCPASWSSCAVPLLWPQQQNWAGVQPTPTCARALLHYLYLPPHGSLWGSRYLCFLSPKPSSSQLRITVCRDIPVTPCLTPSHLNTSLLTHLLPCPSWDNQTTPASLVSSLPHLTYMHAPQSPKHTQTIIVFWNWDLYATSSTSQPTQELHKITHLTQHSHPFDSFTFCQVTHWKGSKKCFIWEAFPPCLSGNVLLRTELHNPLGPFSSGNRCHHYPLGKDTDCQGLYKP